MSETRSISILALDIDGVFTDGKVTYAEDGSEQKSISIRDVDAVFSIRREGYRVALVTGEDSPWVEFLSRRLQLEHTVRGAKDKLAGIQSLADAFDVPLAAICYVGDADRDVPALSAVGLGMVPADATADARSAARVVLKSRGGEGAVHEAVSYLLELRNHQSESAREGRAARSPTGIDFVAAAQQVKDVVGESIGVKQAVAEDLAPDIVKAADAIVASIQTGNKLLVFGNGGSAADAQHLAAEFVGRFERERGGFAAVALTTDGSVVTALGNDYGFDLVFARQVEALARPGDVAIAISTSGGSANVVEGAKAAKRASAYTIGMTGRDGGWLAGVVDLCIRVPSTRTARIQEAHGLIIHILSGIIESWASTHVPSRDAKGPVASS